MSVSGVKLHLYGTSQLYFMNFLSHVCNLCGACTSVFYRLIFSTDYTERKKKRLKYEHRLNNQFLRHPLRDTKGQLVILGWLKCVSLSWTLWCTGIKANRPYTNRTDVSSILISFISATLPFLIRNMATHNKSQDSQIFLQSIYHMTTF